jgi:hypothetical protein
MLDALQLKKVPLTVKLYVFKVTKTLEEQYFNLHTKY